MGIFISYARNDFKIKGGIEKTDFYMKLIEKFDVFVDKNGIAGGEEWHKRLMEEIQKSDVILFINTTNSILSANCLEEIIYARKSRIPVYQLRFREKVDSILTPFLSRNDLFIRDLGIEDLQHIIDKEESPMEIDEYKEEIIESLSKICKPKIPTPSEEELKNKYNRELELIRNAKVQETIKFGSLDNKEDISWLILEKKDSIYTLLSTVITDIQNFDESCMPYEKSNIRKILNDSVHNMFSIYERKLLCPQMISIYQDDISLPSENDVEKIEDKKAGLSQYAFAKKPITSDKKVNDYFGYYLRDEGNTREFAKSVNDRGTVNCQSKKHFDPPRYGVRPVIIIDISKANEDEN